MVHPRTQSPHGKSVAKPETLLLIILNLVYKYHKMRSMVGPKSKSVDRNILGRMTNVETFLQNHQSTTYLLNIMSIFDRCHRSSSAVTLVKYGCDLNNRTCASARLKISITAKLTNGALVTPTPADIWYSRVLGQRSKIWKHSLD